MRNKILVVDDEEINRFTLANMFQEQYQILEAANGEEAISLIRDNAEDLTLIFLDILMPKKNGFDVLKYIREAGLADCIPVILITSDRTDDNMMQGFEYGVADFVNKPFSTRIIIRRAKNIIDLYESRQAMNVKIKRQNLALQKKDNQIQKTGEDILDALASVMEFRNLESGEHIRRIKYFTRILLKYLMKYHPEIGMTQRDADLIVRASALHDIGKIGIRDSILLKPGRFTPSDYEQMQRHSLIGCEILDRFQLDGSTDKDFLRYCKEICHYHHERWDGKGYPEHLRGNQIPVSAQIVAITDVYDALVSSRIYKTAYTHETAVRMIRNGECGDFSPLAMDCFLLAEKDLQATFDAIGQISVGL